MILGIDLDNTIGSFPQAFQTVCSAMVQAGHSVYVVSGADTDQESEIDAATVQGKKDMLTSLGFGPGTYSQLIIVPRPHPTNKAAKIAELGVHMYVDNKAKTTKKASQHAASLLLVNSKEK